MKELTKKQRQKIALEEMALEPMDTLVIGALLKAGELAIDTNAKNLKVSTEATFKNKRYKLTSVYTYKELK